MNAGSFFKDNAKIFLPILGLVIAVVALVFVTTEVDLFPYPALDTQKTKTYEEAPSIILEENTNYQAIVQTSMGDFTINLFENLTPKNVNNFVFLSEEGFYKNLDFHRVVSGFVIQTGDPGTGNPGYFIDDEIRGALKFGEYSVAMANEGSTNTNGSQFFITLKGSDFSHLDANHTLIGEVIDGMNVVEKIGEVKTDENQNPVRRVYVKDIVILKESK
jgi:cyclophilin family peptidyl-prolyl cis-trans isomerase